MRIYASWRCFEYDWELGDTIMDQYGRVYEIVDTKNQCVVLLHTGEEAFCPEFIDGIVTLDFDGKDCWIEDTLY